MGLKLLVWRHEIRVIDKHILVSAAMTCSCYQCCYCVARKSSLSLL